MKRNISFTGEYAVSELVGGLILVMIAVIVFSVILTYVFPLPIPSPKPNVNLMGYVDDGGLIVVEHIGGEPLYHYKIYTIDIDGTPIDIKTYQNEDDPWEIGERIYPAAGIYLLSEDEMVHIIINKVFEGESEQPIFDAVLKGKNSGEIILENPMLISSLRTNTADEDLICFNYTITPIIDALTYIYNWTVDGNSIMDLLMTFDTNNVITAKDYSGDDNDGTVVGPMWNSTGVVGGSYYFDGIDDYISVPFCFDNSFLDEITVEAWIKTITSSEVIASFDRNTLWELGINNGLVRWSTNTIDGATDTIGVTNINDGNWHHVAVTYDSSNGKNIIYIDGEQDKNENGHNPGQSLGTGVIPNGFIGLGSEAVTETIFSTSFETIEEKNEWSKDEARTDDWMENAVFDRLGSDSINPRTGSFSIGGSGNLVYWWQRHNAAYNRTAIDISNYDNVTVSVWYSYIDTESDDEFGFYYYDGSDWIAIFEDFDPDASGGQEPWTYAEAQIPNSIDNLILQFYWSTSQEREFMAIDDLEITGIPALSGGNYSGSIDEFRIYNRALSAEQIYQNYLCTKDGFSDKSVIVSDETQLGDIWRCTVIPNDSNQDDDAVVSNSLVIVSYGGGG